MDKNIYKREQYIDFNKTMLVLIGCLIFLPVIVYIIRLFIPNMVRCPYYELTLDPCPFCGITTDIRNMLKGNIFAYKYNILSVPLILTAIIEFTSRIYFVKVGIPKFDNCKLSKVIKYDIIIHVIGLIVILLYCILFFTLGLSRF